MKSILLCALVALVAARGPALAGPPEVASPDEGVWLGVWLSDAVDGGVQVLALSPGGPALRGGLRTGDLIVELDGQAIADRESLGKVLESHGPGEVVAVGVLRDGKPLTLEVHLGSRRARSVTIVPFPEAPPRPEPPVPPAPRRGAIGLQVTEITPALRRYFGASEESGVLVTRVEPGGLADRAGVRVGDVLVRCGDVTVRNEAQVRGSLVGWRARQPLEVRVVRDKRPVVLRLVVEPEAEAAVGEARGQALRRKIEAEMERLERRLEELRKELEELDRPR